MPFTLEKFASLRPYLFHLTDRENLSLLRGSCALLPASDLFELAKESNWTRQKRRQHVEVVVNGHRVRVRDQAPLHEGNMALSSGWTFADFIANLNQRVFFWPGKRDGSPIAYGVRHYERYADERPVILRIPSASLFASNSTLPPEFCRYNSGSPRWTYGHASPRGVNTFVSCDIADFAAAQVVEVTFPGNVELPQPIQISDSYDGPWETL